MDSPCACHTFLRLSIPMRSGNIDYGLCPSGYFTKRVCTPVERRKIKKSAKDCRLCREIYKHLHRIHRLHLPGRHNLISVLARMSQLNGDAIRISSIEICDPNQALRRDAPRFAVWADRETPASVDFVTWAPTFQDTATETNELVRKLLHSCLDRHKICRLREPVADGELGLPSRVLSIEDDNGSISVNLIETHDLSGRYCALSHCWGPKDKQPLRTTKKLFKDHLSCIPWDTLPPLFRDAITLTRSLDIKYLWIDSLCIIQDDQQDWKNEAEKMSFVYRRATLVIAAADATDSTQRLLNTKRPDSIPFRIPYHAHQGPDHYNISRSIGTVGPLRGPLRERGWVFQELYLGRRKIFFTSEGLRWKCCECELDERGNSTDMKLTETVSWLSCLEEYSKKRLTYSSDRIIALLGIVGEVGQSRKDSFQHESGVWQSELVEQLLWRSSEIRDEDLPYFPSWSWAATGGEKQWVCEHVTRDGIQQVQLAESGSLRASGQLFSVSTAPTPLRECCLEHHRARMHEKEGSRSTIQCALLPGYSGPTDNLPRFPIFHGDNTRHTIGVAFFDRQIYRSGYFCFILATDTRPLRSSLANTALSHPGYNSVSPNGNEGSWSGSVHRDTVECVDLYDVRGGFYIYWALLLYPENETSERFRRIGLALLWPQDWQVRDQHDHREEFKII